MTIGAELRQAREQHGLTIREISDRTKIRQTVLRAIESDDFEHTPGGVILRGFLKLYAREVGIDADHIARRYAAEIQAAHLPMSPEATPASDRAPSVPAGLGAPRAAVGLALVLALVVVVAGYLMWRRAPAEPAGTVTGSTATGPVTAGGPATTRPAGATSSATTTSGATATAGGPVGTAATDPGVLRVEILAAGACWLAATADGEQVAYRVVNSGDRVSLAVKNEAVLRIGMPANVTVSINGAPMRPFARPGTPMTIRITPENYRSLVVP